MCETILVKKSFMGETILVKKCFTGETILRKKCFPIYVIDAVNGTQYHKNTKRNAAKTPNEMPQKHQTKCHKNIKRNATKTPNEMRNPQEISILCLVFNV